uniref:Putative LOC100645596 [Bombus terrestris] n=1 Tax=Lepeophtheirus salmonis TaxID=72036 RepID=A0A0K2UI60_LEPSM
MNPPMIKVPLTPSLPKDERDYFRAPSAPPPINHNGVLPPPSPLAWFQTHCSQTYNSHLNHLNGTSGGSAPASNWEPYNHYLKAISPSQGLGNLSLNGIFCAGSSSPLMSLPSPAHSHSSSYLPLSLKSPPTSTPPMAHSHNDRPYMSSPGIFRPIPSRPSSSATPLVIPRVDFDERQQSKSLKSEEKTAPPIKSEPDYLNDSDSAFEDGDGSFSFCSRTTPVNHKSIKKWRQRSTPSMKSISVNTSTPLRTKTTREEESPCPLSAPGSLSSSWSSPFCSPKNGFQNSSSSCLSTDSLLSSSSIGDQSSPNMFSNCIPHLKKDNNNSGSFSSSKLSKPNENIPVGIAVARLRPNHEKEEDPCLLKKESMKDFSFPLNIPKVPCPLPNKDSTPLLPLGYQWAKDPITGQIYFLPSNPIWATTPGYGYLQWQQDTWLAHQHLQLSLNGLNIPSPALNQNVSSSPVIPSSSIIDSTSHKFEKPFVELISPTTTPEIRVPSRASTTDEKISVGDEVHESYRDEEQVSASPKKDDIEKEFKTEVHEEGDVNGLELLTEGISRMETDSSTKDSTNEDGGSSKNNLSILIDAADTLESSQTDTKKEPIKVEPPNVTHSTLTKLNNIPSDFHRNYRSPEAEREAKAFIASKSVKSPSCIPSSSDEMDFTSPKRSLDDMEAWEIGMRMNLAEIQRKYKEKYKELYKLQKSSSQSRRRKSSSDSGTYTSSKKIKMEKMDKEWSCPGSFSDTFVKKYKPENSKPEKNLSYPWGNKKKLFLSPSNRKNNSDLTLFTDKFKNGRPNPFENLLRLSKNRQSLDDDDDQSEEIVKEEEYDDNKSTDLNLDDDEHDVIDEREIDEKEQAVVANVFQKAKSDVDHDNKSMNSDDYSSSSFVEGKSQEEESVVALSTSPHPSPSTPEPEPLIQENNLVVSPLKIKKNTLVSDSEEFECQLPKKKSKKSKKYKKNKRDKSERKERRVKKMKVSVIRTPPTSSCLDITEDKSIINISFPKYKAHKKKKKWATTSDEEEDIDDDNDLDCDESLGPKTPEDCLLCGHDLRDGLRVLIKIEGHFHPSTIKAISPPDIYGVIVDKERGNKPHIFSREEVLKKAIYEVKPTSIHDVPIGTRVCAYWSQKYNHLYPGTIGEPGSPNPKLDPNYFVNVELDDGDSRDIHIDSVRYLPPDYPLVQYEPDPMAFGCRRKRMFSTDSALSTSSISSNKTIDAKDEVSSKVFRNGKDVLQHVPKVIIKSSDLKFKIKSSPEMNQPNIKSLTNNKSSMAAFLPAQQLWCWADNGIKKGRRILHNAIKRDDDETLSVGACAVFLSTGRPDRPYIGRLESLWEAQGSNNLRNMRVKVRWFYHACETKGKSKEGNEVNNLKLPGALFESYHYDENDVQTISHGCDVLPISEYFNKLSLEPARINTIYENNDLYYLGGNYDPVEEQIKFYPKVLEDYKI